VSAASRLQRLLAMVPWIAAHDGPTLDEVSERFGLTAEELAADLDVMWLVGLPPYTPDALIDVVQEGDRVWIHFADVFDAPQRLTPAQAVALLTAGASLLALPGAEREGPLASGVGKLAAVLGVEADQVLDVSLGGAGADILDPLRQAVADRRRVQIRYYSYGRDELTEREVDPFVIHARDGALYLLGHCHLARAQRRFRLDRISSLAVLDSTFDPLEVDDDLAVFEPDGDDPRVLLDLAAPASWVVDTYPVERVEPGTDGHQRVTLAVAGDAWLERLLVALGPHVVLAEAPPALQGAGRRAADRILARYR
jgi:proteasome accessory factor C